MIYVLVYVDGILVAGNASLVADFNAAITDRFSLKDLGELSYF